MSKRSVGIPRRLRLIPNGDTKTDARYLCECRLPFCAEVIAGGLLVPSGADRDRTGDPLLAKQVLSQLSYRPEDFISLQVSGVSCPPQVRAASSAPPSDQCKCQARHSSERGRSTPSATSRANGCSSPGASRIVGRPPALSSCKELGKPRVLG
jgi:hypothetical protein